ncbi:expressed unknown protein [Seminavis robusta]|uniref:Uncharacterized protein n=1 Tax=Seminavis robusta TaxID=568900 RepID=A0A9N8H372_9STRA|nr:expressed unknown protein [Seminavis robusta]|eukprot:Sro53_g031370.1 n/a (228) ;mRNA; f:57838-58521
MTMPKLLSAVLSLLAGLCCFGDTSTYAYAYIIHEVTPRTTPEEVLSAQLLALQRKDLQTAFHLVSPSHKTPFGVFQGPHGSKFYQHMMHSKGLIGLEQADILLTKRTTDTPSRPLSQERLQRLVGKFWVKPHKMWTEDRWEGLVRVAMMTETPSSSLDDCDQGLQETVGKNQNTDNMVKIQENWWMLSRWTGPGPYNGCFFVEDIRPNKSAVSLGRYFYSLTEDSAR